MSNKKQTKLIDKERTWRWVTRMGGDSFVHIHYGPDKPTRNKYMNKYYYGSKQGYLLEVPFKLFEHLTRIKVKCNSVIKVDFNCLVIK